MSFKNVYFCIFIYARIKMDEIDRFKPFQEVLKKRSKRRLDYPKKIVQQKIVVMEA